MYKVIDLFAGAGGLSLGFLQTGMFDIRVAFENNPDMQETYRRNHRGVEVLGDVCNADYTEIQQRHGPIDVVIGGPPCQGFSNANRQKSTAINKNNMLVKQYIRAILALQPKAFIMENVSMLKSDSHRFYMEHADIDTVERCQIPTRRTSVLLLEPQYAFDDALPLVSNRAALRALRWSDADFFQLNVVYKATRNLDKIGAVLQGHKERLLAVAARLDLPDAQDTPSIYAHRAFEALRLYFEDRLQKEEIKSAIEPAIMVQRMIQHTLELYENNIVVDSFVNDRGIRANTHSFAVYDYLKGILGSEENGYVLTSKVLCAADYGAPQKRMRFIVMGVKKSIAEVIDLPKPEYEADEYLTVRDAILDLEDVETVDDIKIDRGQALTEPDEISGLGRMLRDTDVLMNHIITKTTDVAMERFKALEQGQNFHSLSDEQKNNTYTDAARTQNTIYLRLKYDEPSGTVVNVRKSMWIHPTKDRAISIREAARLQTFPDSFVFYGSKDRQYQQVGNAVPPIMAKAIAMKLAKILKNKEKSKA